MFKNMTKKRIKFVLTAFVMSAMLFFSHEVPQGNRVIYSFVIILMSLGTLVWCLEIEEQKNIWPYLFILPVNLTIGAVLSFFGFPNLSLMLRLLTAISVLFLYYVMLLMLNIAAVANDREKSIPLYRVAVAWAQVLGVVISIPLYSGIFKLNLNPLIQLLFILASTYSIVLFFSWLVDLEEGRIHHNIALMSAFWVLMLSVSIIFLPFEAVFRGLFLSSVLLFGLGYVQGLIRHTLSKQIIIEHILITISFLMIGLLFIP